MPRSLFQRSATVGGVLAVLTLAIAAPASAHVTAKADNLTQGGYATVTFKVPNESDEASTTKLEVNLPADAPVASVSLRPVAGWTGVAVKTKLATPLEAHGTQITETVSKITWTASGDAAIKPGQFQTFDVSMGPLPKVDQMVFKTLQTYSDGNVVRWIDEPATGRSDTDATGASAGRFTSSLVVDASSLSFGTLNVTVAYPPCVTLSALTPTCAEAGAAITRVRTATTPPTAAERLSRERGMFSEPSGRAVEDRFGHWSSRPAEKFPAVANFSAAVRPPGGPAKRHPG